MNSAEILGLLANEHDPPFRLQTASELRAWMRQPRGPESSHLDWPRAGMLLPRAFYTGESMSRIFWNVAIVATLAVPTDGLALPKNMNSTVYCKCHCEGKDIDTGLQATIFKFFPWSGPAAGCRDYNGGGCTLNTPSGLNVGTLKSCDVFVDRPSHNSPKSRYPSSRGSGQ